jgi:hypothetical protein
VAEAEHGEGTMEVSVRWCRSLVGELQACLGNNTTVSNLRAQPGQGQESRSQLEPLMGMMRWGHSEQGYDLMNDYA